MLQNTLQKIRTRKKTEKGFTLIELIIVIAIIGILVAIAIPVYGAIQSSARNSTMKATATNALKVSTAAMNDESTSMAYAEDDYFTTDKVRVVMWNTNNAKQLCAEAYWKTPSDNVPIVGAGPGVRANGTCSQ